MQRISRIAKQKRKAGALVAAAFIVLMFADLASHSVLASHGSDAERSWMLCGGSHDLPSADCPHKRSPFGPQQVFTDDASHRVLLITEEAVPVVGTAYSTESPFDYQTLQCSRPLEPPFDPPKQS